MSEIPKEKLDAVNRRLRDRIFVQNFLAFLACGKSFQQMAYQIQKDEFELREQFFDADNYTLSRISDFALSMGMEIKWSVLDDSPPIGRAQE